MNKTVNKTVSIFALYDTMTKEFMPVFQMQNIDTAIRNVVTAHIKGNIEFPDDIHLIKLGELQIIEDNDATLVNGPRDLGSISSLADIYISDHKISKDIAKDPTILKGEE